jgi:hypothetical protein
MQAGAARAERAATIDPPARGMPITFRLIVHTMPTVDFKDVQLRLFQHQANRVKCCVNPNRGPLSL